MLIEFRKSAQPFPQRVAGSVLHGADVCMDRRCCAEEARLKGGVESVVLVIARW
jgi:hypothetical protein